MAVKLAVEEPAATATEAGVAKDALLSERATVVLDAAAAERVTVQLETELDGTVEGEHASADTVGKTEPVPFITAFTTDRVGEQDRVAIQEILLELIELPKLCEVLETQHGFVELADASVTETKKK